MLCRLMRQNLDKSIRIIQKDKNSFLTGFTGAIVNIFFYSGGWCTCKLMILNKTTSQTTTIDMAAKLWTLTRFRNRLLPSDLKRKNTLAGITVMMEKKPSLRRSMGSSVSVRVSLAFVAIIHPFGD